MHRTIVILAVLLVSLGATAQTADRFRITLLGTGTPKPVMERFGPSILVEAGSEVLLFDAGRGSLQRLEQAGVPYARLTALFLTHLHSDHVVGLPDLWLSGWLVSRRATPLEVWGPAGTAEMVARLREAYEFDLQIRVEDDQANAEGGRLIATDVEEGVVVKRNGVTVKAFLVDHAPIEPALGYRIDYRGHSVVLSGDTRKSENLIKHAKGVDVLIHEVAASDKDDLARSSLSRSILAHHTTAAEAAAVFRETAPKLAVYSHIVLRGAASADDVLRDTRRTYDGKLVMGSDLMTIDVFSGTRGSIAAKSQSR
ncbi:MAG TPA: MBL fold metallo-hydrolase [Thermoanaerobaculia bacterium]